ncbi:hypothetical protein GCM10007424_26070 [Flavobacterium suaedae]|uniref:DUF6438 domain-containing protein n=1 Tax=Flavobacterium suaedae TaxID=1767027 RepID=A0ABQ1K5G8_9FLAO|nr:DUF6438 domain-containing protein [Flavobacterium suaedae]GGB84808.1 hypothetical protein GCM10007424_26070 [Flavobacterium suaedae]
MKSFLLSILLFLLLSCNQQTKAQTEKAIIKSSEINSLKNEQEVEHFIRKSDSLYRKFTLKKVQDLTCIGCDSSLVSLANRLNVDYTYIKADFDNNGYMDILATGENKTYTSENFNPDLDVAYSKSFNAFVIMDFGEGKTKLYDLTEEIYRGIVPMVEYQDDKALLIVYTPKYETKVVRNKRKGVKSELIFKFSDFVEYNPLPKAYSIEKIEYNTEGCFGQCPIFSMEINKNGTSVFIAKEYNYTKPWQKGELLEGVYSATIKKENLSELTEVLNYIDFPSLQDHYNVIWTDDQTAVLKVTYNNGKVKTIKDYGLQGTYGMRKLHEMFFNLRTNQNWE